MRIRLSRGNCKWHIFALFRGKKSKERHDFFFNFGEKKISLIVSNFLPITHLNRSKNGTKSRGYYYPHHIIAKKRRLCILLHHSFYKSQKSIYKWIDALFHFEIGFLMNFFFLYCCCLLISLPSEIIICAVLSFGVRTFVLFLVRKRNAALLQQIRSGGMLY